MSSFVENEGMKWTAWCWILIALVLLISVDRNAYIEFYANPSFWLAVALTASAAAILFYQRRHGVNIAPNFLQLLGGAGAAWLATPIIAVAPSGPPKNAVLFSPPPILVIGEQMKVSAITSKDVSKDQYEALKKKLMDEGVDAKDLREERLAKGFPWLAIKLSGLDISVDPDDAQTQQSRPKRPDRWEWVIEAKSNPERSVPTKETRYIRLTVLGKTSPDDDGVTVMNESYPVQVVSSWQGWAAFVVAIINFVIEHWEILCAGAAGLLTPVGIWLIGKKRKP